MFIQVWMAWNSCMHEAPADSTLLWHVESHPVHGSKVAKAETSLGSSVDGSMLSQSWHETVAAAARTTRAAMAILLEVVSMLMMIFFVFSVVRRRRRRRV